MKFRNRPFFRRHFGKHLMNETQRWKCLVSGKMDICSWEELWNKYFIWNEGKPFQSFFTLSFQTFPLNPWCLPMWIEFLIQRKLNETSQDYGTRKRRLRKPSCWLGTYLRWETYHDCRKRLNKCMCFCSGLQGCCWKMNYKIKLFKWSYSDQFRALGDHIQVFIFGLPSALAFCDIRNENQPLGLHSQM